MLQNLNKNELLDLLNAYDKYIKDIVEDLPLQHIDRVPVCINEFYNNDYEKNIAYETTYAICIQIEDKDKEEHHYKADTTAEALGRFFMDNECLSYSDIISCTKL